MPLIKSAFRDRVREQIGDPLRILGTVTSGSLNTIIDTSRLTQIDGYWDKLWAFIITTTDNGAPKNEARRISAFANSTKQLTLELPFSAEVEAGDTYGIAIFSNSRIDNIISGVLKEFSDFRPLKFNEPLAVTANEKRFTPTSYAVIRQIYEVEEYQAGVKDLRYNFVWDRNSKRVVFPAWFGENKTLTIYAGKTHTLPANDSDPLTYDDEDEDSILRWCAARAMMALTADEFRDNFGKLAPKSWTRGKVSQTNGDSRDTILEYCNAEIEGIKKTLTEPVSIYGIAGTPTISNGRYSVNYHADPDGRPAPSLFWTQEA